MEPSAGFAMPEVRRKPRRASAASVRSSRIKTSFYSCRRAFGGFGVFFLGGGVFSPPLAFCFLVGAVWVFTHRARPPCCHGRPPLRVVPYSCLASDVAAWGIPLRVVLPCRTWSFFSVKGSLFPLQSGLSLGLVGLCLTARSPFGLGMVCCHSIPFPRGALLQSRAVLVRLAFRFCSRSRVFARCLFVVRE